MPQLDEMVDGQAQADVVGEADVGLAVRVRSEPDDDAAGGLDLDELAIDLGAMPAVAQPAGGEQDRVDLHRAQLAQIVHLLVRDRDRCCRSA